MSLNKHGFWEGGEVALKDQHYHDDQLVESLINFFKKEKAQSVADLGCGTASYVQAFRKVNINADAYDGNPNTPELTNNVGKVLDLAVPFKFKKPYDWIMSLEVAEHLPKQFEDIYIQNLHNNNQSGIVLSWALEGQQGWGHYNERNNDYVKAKMTKLGYTNDVAAEEILRKSAAIGWFRNTLMVFRRIKQ
jgi:hypothetical protein